MRRILFLANLKPNKFGSMEEHALFLSRELLRRGHVCYLGFVSEPEPEIRRQFEEAGAQILTFYGGDTPLVGSGASLQFREILALRRMVVKNRIDLVHINFMGLTNPVLLGVYLTQAKIVFTEHASGLPLSRGPVKQIISKCINAALSQRVSKYIGVSNYVRDRFSLTHHVTGVNAVTIYNGINLERFCPRDQGEARAELDLPVGRPIICSVSMLIPEKGIQLLIKAVELLVKSRRLPGLLALVVGEGYYREELERIVLTLGITDHINFLGRRSDVQKIIAASDTVVVPSIWEEAFGLIVAEALAVGRPVVASRVGGIPELVINGESGYLVPAGQFEELAKGIENSFSEAFRAKIATIGRRKALTFCLAEATRKTVDLYDQVLNN